MQIQALVSLSFMTIDLIFYNLARGQKCRRCLSLLVMHVYYHVHSVKVMCITIMFKSTTFLKSFFPNTSVKKTMRASSWKSQISSKTVDMLPDLLASLIIGKHTCGPCTLYKENVTAKQKMRDSIDSQKTISFFFLHF